MFILRMIHECGKPQWNDIDRKKLLIVHQRYLVIILAELSSSEVGGYDEVNAELCLRNISFILVGFFNMS
jgi:hypothetical protein